jgi:hypothetical protein
MVATMMMVAMVTPPMMRAVVRRMVMMNGAADDDDGPAGERPAEDQWQFRASAPWPATCRTCPTRAREAGGRPGRRR